jgi:hypothetical protein
VIFYVDREGAEIGPFSEEEFREKILAGDIKPGDHYWKEGMADWQLVSEFRGLPSPSAAPPLPPVPRLPKKKKKQTTRFFL